VLTLVGKIRGQWDCVDGSSILADRLREFPNRHTYWLEREDAVTREEQKPYEVDNLILRESETNETVQQQWIQKIVRPPPGK
jgi:hypothetical protein